MYRMLCKAMHSYMQHEEYTEVNRTILAFKLTEEDKVKKKKGIEYLLTFVIVYSVKHAS